jgi:hypothetical protein
MEREREDRLGRELRDPQLTAWLVGARRSLVRPVPDRVARDHLRRILAATAGAGRTGAGWSGLATTADDAAPEGATGAGAGATGWPVGRSVGWPVDVSFRTRFAVALAAFGLDQRPGG